MAELTEAQRKFIDVLISGEFPQGRFQLRTNDDEYCCMGVMCETFRRDTGQGQWEKRQVSGRSEWVFVLDGVSSASFPPDGVRNHYGLSYVLPTMPDLTDSSAKPCNAIGANDSSKYGFVQIAESFRRLWTEADDQ